MLTPSGAEIRFDEAEHFTQHAARARFNDVELLGNIKTIASHSNALAVRRVHYWSNCIAVNSKPHAMEHAANLHIDE